MFHADTGELYLLRTAGSGGLDALVASNNLYPLKASIENGAVPFFCHIHIKIQSINLPVSFHKEQIECKTVITYIRECLVTGNCLSLFFQAFHHYPVLLGMFT